jgi:catechol 2,3-dioxygenase-like lactoylglutathione lyase family enzyme
MTKSCHHIGIFTNRPQALKKFYEAKLGFKLEAAMDIGGKIIKQIFGIAAACRLIRLRLQGIRLEIFSCPGRRFKKTGRGSLGYNHWALTVADKAAFCKLMVKKGVKVIKIDRGSRYTYFIQDPDKNLIEIRDGKPV